MKLRDAIEGGGRNLNVLDEDMVFEWAKDALYALDLLYYYCDGNVAYFGDKGYDSEPPARVARRVLEAAEEEL